MRKSILWLLLAMGLSASSATAQTGKIAGRVTDAASNDALPGVNVVIDGTNIGATSDVDGYYTIINVRSGTYILRATFVGFADQEVLDVRVTTGLTTEINIAMREEAVGLEEVVVTAEAPIIQRDISGSQRSIGADEIRTGRYQNINNVVGAQVSVGATGIYNDRPRIRASSLEESKFIVDGVDQSDPMTNRPYQRINLDAVEEVQLLTGGFSAEYGNLRSGVVNVVTRSGGDRYSGSANVQYSPPALKHFGAMPYGFDSDLVRPFADPSYGAFSGNNFFAGWVKEAENPSRDPQHTGNPGELYALWLWRHRSQDAINRLEEIAQAGYVADENGTQYPVNVQWSQQNVGNPDELVFHETGDEPDMNLSFTLGGPLPGLDAVKFFASYDQNQVEYFSAFPQPHYLERNFRGKLTTNLARNTRLDLHGMWATQKGTDGGQGPGVTSLISSNPYRSFDSSNKFWYSHCSVPGQQNRQIYGAQLTHTFNANTFLDVDFSHQRVDYKMLNEIRNTMALKGPGLDGQTSALQGNLGTDADIAGTDANGEPISDFALVKIGDYWYDEAPVGYSPVWWVDVTGYFRMSSCNVRYNDSYSRSYDFKTALTSQVNRNNLVKVGVQARYDDIYQDYRALDPSVNGGSVELNDGAQWLVGLYATDKLEYQGFVANIGVRIDGFIYGDYPILDGTGDGSVYTKYLLSGNTITTGEGGVPNYDMPDVIEAAVPGVNRSVQHWRISPRIGIAHPISTVAKIFFNYGHMYQSPTAYDIYRVLYQTREGYRVSRMGNPLVEPPRTIQYEVGYEHNILDRMNLRITGYYKDINNELGEVRYYPLGQSDWRRPENMEFRDVRGLETFLELRRGVVPYISGFASVNYLVESGGRFGYEYYYQDPTRQPRQVSTEVSNPDVRPILKGALTFSTPQQFGPGLSSTSLLGGLDVSLSYTWQRGYQFTWNPAQIPLVENNLRWKPRSRVDLRLQKDLFSKGTVDAMFYVDITNLLNQKNLVPVNNPSIESENLTQFEEFAWDGMKWYTNTFQKYMNSIGYSASDQNADGSFDTDKKPGYVGDDAELSPWDSFQFLEKRDIFFGIKFYF